MTIKNLQAQLEHALSEARAQETNASLWDIVEELCATLSHKEKQQTYFEIYCNKHPDSLECRVYED